MNRHAGRNGAIVRRFALLLLVALILIADQGTKALARDSLRGEGAHPYAFLTLLYTENSGAFLSMGSNLPEQLRAAIFDGFVTLAIIASLAAALSGRIGRTADEVALALIAAGGAGNLIDRIHFRGVVTDFMILGTPSLHTGVFNVADMAITAGVLWLMVSWSAAVRKRKTARE